MIDINKHIHLINLKGGKFPRCNCLWITDDCNCLIDSSTDEKNLQYLKKQTVDIIINSHGHIDHYFNNDCFPASKVLMHPADHDMAQSKEKFLEEFGYNAFANDDLTQQSFLQAFQYKTTRIDGNIEDNQIISMGSTKLQIIHLPGHSAGHCGLLFPEEGFVFTADIDLNPYGPWYANMNSSLSDLLRSIDRLLEMKPDYIITGHGEGIVKEDLSRRLKTYRDIIYARQERILDLINNGRHTIDEIASECPIYPQLHSANKVQNLTERLMVLIHLR